MVLPTAYALDGLVELSGGPSLLFFIVLLLTDIQISVEGTAESDTTLPWENTMEKG